MAVTHFSKQTVRIQPDLPALNHCLKLCDNLAVTSIEPEFPNTASGFIRSLSGAWFWLSKASKKAASKRPAAFLVQVEGPATNVEAFEKITSELNLSFPA